MKKAKLIFFFLTLSFPILSSGVSKDYISYLGISYFHPSFFETIQYENFKALEVQNYSFKNSSLWGVSILSTRKNGLGFSFSILYTKSKFAVNEEHLELDYQALQLEGSFVQNVNLDLKNFLKNIGFNILVGVGFTFPITDISENLDIGNRFSLTNISFVRGIEFYMNLISIGVIWEKGFSNLDKMLKGGDGVFLNGRYFYLTIHL